MFRNVELMPWKGLKNREVGKPRQNQRPLWQNSSGKSTVLECIAEPSRRSPGRVLEPSEIESIVGRNGARRSRLGNAKPDYGSRF